MVRCHRRRPDDDAERNAVHARFNIGSIYRNFNNPTLALQFIDASYRSRFVFTFDPEAHDENVNGAVSRKVNFTEVQRPTLIDEYGQDRAATGALWIRVDDGALTRTMLRLPGRASAPEVSITVDYRYDRKLEMWVPSHMEELYRTVVIGENPGSTMRTGTLSSCPSLASCASINLNRFRGCPGSPLGFALFECCSRSTARRCRMRSC